ncbi:MAG: DUF456 domain-containing protein [Thermodesulfobacteriota bacterium]
MFEIIVIIIGAILILLGLAGSILPVLPGPPLCFIGLLLLGFIKDFSHPLTPWFFIVMGLILIAALGLDYIIPVWGAKKYGASKWGIWGSVLGMAIGIFFSPFGILLGALMGALAGEWLFNREKGRPLRAAWGVFVGTILGTILKLGLSAVMAYYFILTLFY